MVASGQSHGAATFLLPGQIRRKLLPQREGVTIPAGVLALSDPTDFARELVAAGFRDAQIEDVTFDYDLVVAALAAPDTLFGMLPDWASLDAADRAALVEEVRTMVGDRPSLPIPSTALIAVARRRAASSS